MPIKLPSSLPAFDVLSKEGVMVMSDDEAVRQDIRPLQIGLLNLMPKKIECTVSATAEAIPKKTIFFKFLWPTSKYLMISLLNNQYLINK